MVRWGRKESLEVGIRVVMTYGSCAEVNHGHMELSCSLLPSSCMAASSALRDVSVGWRTWVASAVCFGLGLRCSVKTDAVQRKLSWIKAAVSSGCPTHQCYIAVCT